MPDFIDKGLTWQKVNIETVSLPEVPPEYSSIWPYNDEDVTLLSLSVEPGSFRAGNGTFCWLESMGNDFLNQVKYSKTVQDNNQKLLYTVQETKSNAEKQKKLREDKKIELDKLTKTLNITNMV